MTMEAGVVVDVRGRALFWHVPPGRTSGSLPDSRDLWEVFWHKRSCLFGFAHTHPGKGMPFPSNTDLTTFEAVEKALGRTLSWWVVSEDRVALCVKRDDKWTVEEVEQDLEWLDELRRVSYR